MISSRVKRIAFGALVLGVGILPALAEESVSPYIDSIKAKMKEPSVPEPSSDNPEPFIQAEKKKLEGSNPQQPQGTQPYIDRLKAKNHDLNAISEPSKSFTEEEKAKLAPDEGEGAIAKFAEGKSQLELKRPGKIKASMGFKLGTVMDRSFTGSSDVIANPFSAVYGSGFAPDLTLMLEYRLFHSEIYGSLGLMGSIGGSLYKGSGIFANSNLVEPDGTTPFGSKSRTKFTFFAIPVGLGPKYSFNLMKYVCPYGIAEPVVIGMAENRNDGIASRKALSKGIDVAAGVAIQIDGLSRSSSWNLYQDYDIKHYYLTVEYNKLTSIASAVDVSYSGVNVGFNFDF